MENLEKKLQEIQDLIKKIGLLPSPKVPKPPAAPTIAPSNQKNPVNVAQQIDDPATKKIAVKQARKIVKIGANGQWSMS